MFVSLGGDEISSRQLHGNRAAADFSAEAEDIGQVCQQVVSSLKNYYSIGYLTEIRAGDKSQGKSNPGSRHKCTVHFPPHLHPGLIPNLGHTHNLTADLHGFARIQFTFPNI